MVEDVTQNRRASGAREFSVSRLGQLGIKQRLDQRRFAAQPGQASAGSAGMEQRSSQRSQCVSLAGQGQGARTGVQRLQWCREGGGLDTRVPQPLGDRRRREAVEPNPFDRAAEREAFLQKVAPG